MVLKKGDLVYLPSDIMLVGSWLHGSPQDWIRLDEPSTGVIIESNFNNENIYHRIHAKGTAWYVRTIDTLEVMSHA
jgi:hypothetical protein